MDTHQKLSRLQKCYLAGRLTETEYNQLRDAVIWGEPICARLRELEKNQRPEPKGG